MMKKSTKYLKILVNFLVALFVIVCLAVLLPRVVVFFMPFVIGWIISAIANPLVRLLEKKMKIVRKHSSMVIIIGVLAAVVGLGYLAASRIVLEAGNLIANLPQIYANWQEDFEEIGQNLQVFYNRLSPDIQKSIQNVSTNFAEYASSLVQAIGELVAFAVAFLDALPFFGTGTVLAPWAIIKILSNDYQMAVGLLILYAVSQVVRQVIQPKIVGDTIGMDPLATLFFMFIGYKVSSIIGMIIAVPIGMILINLYQAGVFDNQIRCVRELVKDINEFRRF